MGEIIGMIIAGLIGYGVCFGVVGFAMVSVFGDGSMEQHAGYAVIAASILFHGIGNMIISGADLKQQLENVSVALNNIATALNKE